MRKASKPPYSDQFRRELVDEALNRTPPGGFPELEKRHGLPAGMLFDWVDELATDLPPAPFSAQHVWIGETRLGAEAFERYFEHDPAYWTLEPHDIEATDRDQTGCGFCQDLDTRYLYDEDLLLVVHHAEPRPVADLVNEIGFSSDAACAAVVRACEARGIHRANAMFVYADPTQAVQDPGKRYNDLAYVGLFPDD